jgi:hypothetical protein
MRAASKTSVAFLKEDFESESASEKLKVAV